MPAKNDTDRLAQAFRLCLARTPGSAEQDRLQKLLQQQLIEEPGDANTKQREAWKTLARVLLNLDETITRE